MHDAFTLSLLVLAALAAFIATGLLVLVVRGRRQLEIAKRLAEEREQRYRSLFESSLGGIALFAADGSLREWNNKLPELLGDSEVEADAGNLLRPVQWQGQATNLAKLARELAPGVQRETSFIAGDGTRRWVTLRHWPMTATKDGDFWLLMHDVTRRQKTRTLLRLAEQLYHSISEAILITDVTTRIVEVNPAFEQITGYPRDDVIGMRSSLLRSSRHDEAFFTAMWRELAEKGHWVGEVWNRCRDGAEIPCWMHIDALKDPQNKEITHYIGVFSDISERKATEERISFLAHHDPLTGLANRLSLDVVLPQSISIARRNEQKVALLFVDLDYFKEINDTLGHSAGDLVLVEIGRRLMQAVRESDFIARMGGDEFIILLNEITGAEDALRVATTVLESLQRPIIVAGTEVTITPSIGISLFPEDGDEAETLLGCADNAMYRAKNGGRNGYHFHSQH